MFYPQGPIIIMESNKDSFTAVNKKSNFGSKSEMERYLKRFTLKVKKI